MATAINTTEQEADQIQALTDILYASICFDEGKQPDFVTLKSLFIKSGYLINNNVDTPLLTTIDEFIEAVDKQIAVGSCPVVL